MLCIGIHSSCTNLQCYNFYSYHEVSYSKLLSIHVSKFHYHNDSSTLSIQHAIQHSLETILHYQVFHVMHHSSQSVSTEESLVTLTLVSDLQLFTSAINVVSAQYRDAQLEPACLVENGVARGHSVTVMKSRHFMIQCLCTKLLHTPLVLIVDLVQYL